MLSQATFPIIYLACSIHPVGAQDGRIKVRMLSLAIPTSCSKVTNLKNSPRQELLAWLNNLLQLNVTKVEQCGTGYGLHLRLYKEPSGRDGWRHVRSAEQLYVKYMTVYIVQQLYTTYGSCYTANITQRTYRWAAWNLTSTPNMPIFKISRCCRVSRIFHPFIHKFQSLIRLRRLFHKASNRAPCTRRGTCQVQDAR